MTSTIEQAGRREKSPDREEPGGIETARYLHASKSCAA
jgi:hypothetical protein